MDYDTGESVYTQHKDIGKWPMPLIAFTDRVAPVQNSKIQAEDCLEQIYRHH